MFPRQKIYLSSLSQLIEKKVVVQPEVEVNNKLFPQRNFAKKLSFNHQRMRSNVQLRTHKFDLHWTSKQSKNMTVENNKQLNHSPNKRMSLQKEPDLGPQFRSTQFTSSTVLVPTSARPMTQQFGSSTLPEKRRMEEGERPESPQKNFLRKGSNLQKQIVVNLLRSKLIKER